MDQLDPTRHHYRFSLRVTRCRAVFPDREKVKWKGQPDRLSS
jgi:hypothetical protein